MGGDKKAAAADIEEVLLLRVEVTDLRKQLAAKEEELNDVSGMVALAGAELQVMQSQKAVVICSLLVAYLMGVLQEVDQ